MYPALQMCLWRPENGAETRLAGFMLRALYTDISTGVDKPWDFCMVVLTPPPSPDILGSRGPT